MGADVGRNIVLNYNGGPIAGVRTKNPAFNREPIDITDDDSAGWRELLAIPGQKQVNLPVSGICETPVLREAFFGSDVLENLELMYPDGGVLSGNFFMSSYTETVEYNGAITF